MFKSVLAALAIFAATSVTATTIDTDVIDRIYRQPAFGASPFDIRISAVQELVAPEFVELESEADIAALFDTKPDGPTINLFLVEEIRFGLGFASGITEFDQTGFDPRTFLPEGTWGNNIAYVRSQNNPGLSRGIAHELGHALGLHHEFFIRNGFPDQTNVPDNLMNFFASSEVLTEAQVQQMLLSPFLQGNASDGYFVDVDVFDVVAAPTTVPLPAGLLLLLTGTGALAVRSTRKRAP